jgi:hypothetical protein
MPDERRDGYLDREGWQKLAGLASDVQHHAATLGQVAKVVERSDRTLRGYNGEVGVVATLLSVGDKVNVLTERVDRLADARPGGEREERRLAVYGKWAVAISALASLAMHLLTYAKGLIP